MQSVVDTSGHSSMVELQPSKLAVRVRFPLPAPECVSQTLVHNRLRFSPRNPSGASYAEIQPRGTPLMQ